MPPTTRSRVSGIVRKVRYQDSSDSTDSNSEKEVQRKPRTVATRRKKDSDVDSEFSVSNDDTVSESTDGASGASGDHVDSRGVDDYTMDDGEDIDLRRGKSKRSPATRSVNSKPRRHVGLGEPSPSVIKLRAFPLDMLTVSSVELAESIEADLRGNNAAIATIQFLSAKYTSLIEELGLSDKIKSELELETVNLLLDYLCRIGVHPIAQFRKSSCLGINHALIKQYFSKLQEVARGLLQSAAGSSQAELGEVDTHILHYDPKWINSIPVVHPSTFTEQ